MLLSKSVALAEGVLALSLLGFLQFAIAWTSVRLPWFKHLIKSEPSLLVQRGEFLEGAMRAQRITRDEVFAALRSQGVSDAAEVAAAVLETDGSLSIIQQSEGMTKTGRSTLTNVNSRR